MANATLLGLTHTPQTVKADSRQTLNRAGGYTFELTDLDRFKRFLILGANKGFYGDTARENLELITRLDPILATDIIVEYAQGRRAPKQDPALFALAILASHGSDEGRSYALKHLNKVATTASTLFTFVRYTTQYRGWGRALKNAVARWYNRPDVEYQVVKYRQREGYTHRDLLRLTHTRNLPTDLAEYAVRGTVTDTTPLAQAFEEAKTSSPKRLQELITEHNLTWEMVPTGALNDPDTWATLLPRMPLTALVRNLPKMTSVGLFGVFSEHTKTVTERLENPKGLHPLNLLVALKTYAQGHGIKGSLSWEPNQEIVQALDKAFYKAFGNVEATGKRFLIGVDVSGSMGYSQVAGLPLTPAEAAAAVTMQLVKTESQTHVVGFDRAVRPLNIHPSQRLDDVLRETRSYTFGSTDTAALIRYAIENKIVTDVFLVITDNETYDGGQHTHQALRDYRRNVNPDAKAIFLSTEATGSTVLDPNDSGSLDIAGFDLATLQIVSEFVKGF